MQQSLSQETLLEKTRAQLARIKEIAAHMPTETIQMLDECIATIQQHQDTAEWTALKAEAYHYLSIAQTSLTNYEEGEQSARTALTLFHQLKNKMMMASVLNNLGRIEYYRANFHKALDFYNDSLALRRELNDKKGIAAALNNIGLVYHSFDNQPQALKCYEESLAIKRELGDRKGMASTLNNIGLIHTLLGEYSKAIECYRESLNLRDPATELREIANIHLNIGEVYLLLGDYSKASQVFRESLKISREINDKRYEALALDALGSTCQKMKEYDTALAYHKDALTRFEEIGLQFSVASALGNLAKVYEDKGNYDFAFECYQQSLERLSALGDQSTMVRVKLEIGKMLVKQKKYEFAKTYLNEVLTKADKLSLKRERYEAYEQLAILHEHLGEFELAFHAYRNFHTIKETVFNEEQSKKVAVQQALFENELARKEADRHRQQSIELAKALAETERLKKIAEEANAFKTELLAIAAHDLKNPLQAVMGFAQLIRENPNDIERAATAAEMIERAATRMYKLIEALLISVQVETNVLNLKKSQVKVADLLCAVVEHNRPNAERKSQKIELSLEEDCIAELDTERISEVFENLISNAIKYSPMEKQITITCKKQLPQHDMQPATILIAVKDEGQGLTEEDKQKLFGKFQRLSAKPTGGESSTGLGLAIVKQLVELHGGKVWAESEGKDKGATFFVELPMK